MHTCIGKLTIIDSDNCLVPERHQAIIWTNAGMLLIGPLGTNFSEILIEIQTFSLKKICLNMSSVKCCPFLLGLNVIGWQHGIVMRCSKHKIKHRIENKYKLTEHPIHYLTTYHLLHIHSIITHTMWLQLQTYIQNTWSENTEQFKTSFLKWHI